MPREGRAGPVSAHHSAPRPLPQQMNRESLSNGTRLPARPWAGRPEPGEESGRGAHTWDGEKGRVLTGVLLGVRLLQESRKDRLELLSVTGDSVTRLFFCRLSTEGGVPTPKPLTSVLGEMGMSSPRLPRLRSEMVGPSRRYSVTLGPGAAGCWGGGACCCSEGCGCTGLLLTLPSADGSSGRSNLLRSHQASGSWTERGGVRYPCDSSAFLPADTRRLRSAGMILPNSNT